MHLPFLIVLLSLGAVAAAQTTRPNVLLITADDMNFDTPGFAGGKVPDITPNLDRLASQGIYFQRAHVTAAVCQPSRSVLMTGRYPHRNGAEGFQPIRDDVPTLGEQLRAAGYYNGIFAKVPHLAPIPRFCWDVIVDAEDLGIGRDPKLYRAHAEEFFAAARRLRRPFFLMANSQDPHRPFAGSDAEKTRDVAAAGDRPRRQPQYPGASRYYEPGEVTVPGWLPDLPDVRKELAQYYSSAHRCDESVGAVLEALEESGLADNTLVVFLSDNGMSEPPAKSNCYLTSTRTPWLVRWPGRIEPGQVDGKHGISGIDFLPTILDAVGLPPLQGLDGRSFLPLLLGKEQAGRETVVTVYHETSAKKRYEMRCLQDLEFGYIYNGWSDGKTTYRAEPMTGLAFKAMQAAAAKGDAAIAARVQFLQHRVPEELYDLRHDPDELRNLIDDQKHEAVRQRMRERLLRWMQQTGDPQLAAYRGRFGPR